MKAIILYLCAFTVLLLGLTLAFGSWGTVEAGHRGVLLRNGAVSGEVKGEGLYFKTPWIDHVQQMSVRNQKEETETDAASKDLQTVTAHIALNINLQPDSVATMYQQVGMNYASVIVDPALKEASKAVISQYTAEELITKRAIVREGIATLIASKLTPYGIKTDAVNIVNFNFSKSFNQAIEAKVTAEQNALAAKNKLEQIKFEADQKIAEARGKAEAIRVESAALSTSPQILQLRALEKWDGRLPQVTGTGAMPFVNLASYSSMGTFMNVDGAGAIKFSK